MWHYIGFKFYAMNNFLQFIFENKEWIFSGIGVSVIAGVIALIRKQSGTKEQNQSVSQTVNVNIPIGESLNNDNKQFREKEEISILFIDDQSFDYVKNLKQAGYVNVKKISVVKRIDSPEICNANIIFVDINGVGESLFPKEQGLGVAKAIKKRFRDKKVYLYSAQHHALNSDFNFLDGVLSKNADPYEFINIIDNYRNISE